MNFVFDNSLFIKKYHNWSILNWSRIIDEVSKNFVKIYLINNTNKNEI